MTNIKIKCLVCGQELKGIGYQMPSLSNTHMKEKHNKDWQRIDELEIELINIKNRYGLYLYGTY